MEAVEKWFFNEDFWLPPNLTWKNFENSPDDDIYIAQPRHLVYSLPFAVVLFIIRVYFERYVAYPFGVYMNISTKQVTCPPNPKLEVHYRRQNYPKPDAVKMISKQTDMSERSIERWYRKRRNQDRPSAMTKFTETGWRLFYYIWIFVYGVAVLWNKPWFTNTTECWSDFPRVHVPVELQLYYMIEMGFYLGLLFSQFRDVKRKDFLEQATHHLTTLLLMSFSWMCNAVRMGTLVLCLHDVVDWMLEAAKLCRYMNKKALCDAFFALFTVMWMVSRLMMYPYYILYSTSVEVNAIVGPAKSIYLFNLLLWILFVLHILWFAVIAVVAYKALMTGQVEKDIRSASEESDSSENTENVEATNGKPSKKSTLANGVKSD